MLKMLPFAQKVFAILMNELFCSWRHSDWTLDLKIEHSTILYWISYWILEQTSLVISESCLIIMHAYWIFLQNNAGKSSILLKNSFKNWIIRDDILNIAEFKREVSVQFF